MLFKCYVTKYAPKTYLKKINGCIEVFIVLPLNLLENLPNSYNNQDFSMD